jgi:hypothetical protein
MKKFILAMVASFAFIGSVHAIPSNLNQSLREFTAIEKSELLSQTISQSEFIIEIERETKDLNADTVVYKIKTVSFASNSDCNCDGKCSERKKQKNRYKVTLELTPNEAIGPKVITVVSIEEV